MVLSTLDIWVIIAYFVITLVIGLIFTKKAGTNLESYFLGGRNLPWHLAGLSMVATTFAADTPLAVTEMVTKDGIAGNWLWWNFAMGGMLTTFFFARLWRRSGVLTEVEFIELRYSGKPAAFLRGFRAVYLGLFMNVLIMAWVNKALMTILEVFFGLGPSEQFMYTALALVIVMVYSSLSGLLGVVFTDAIQFVIAITGCIILAILVLNSDKIGGIEGLKAQLPESSLNFLPRIDGAGDVANMLTLSVGSFIAYIGFMWWTSWYPGAEPGGGGYVAQRMMSTKNEKHSIYATLFFQLAHYCLRPWPWIIVALCSVVLYPEIAETNPKAGYVMAMKEFLPSGLRGLLLVAFLAAYMSTISTQLNWGASYLVNDFLLRFFKRFKNASDKKSVRISRLVTVVMMVFSLLVTTRVTSIEGVWKFIMECGAGLGLVLILRWYWWRVNAWSEIVASVVPFVVYGVIMYLRWHYQGDNTLAATESMYPGLFFPYSFFIIVGITTVSWLVVTFFTSTDRDHLLRFYEKVNPGGAWKPIMKLSRINLEKPNLKLYFACWILAVIFTYSFLFFTGKLILQFYDEAMIFGAVSIVSLVVFVVLIRRSKLFD